MNYILVFLFCLWAKASAAFLFFSLIAAILRDKFLVATSDIASACFFSIKASLALSIEDLFWLNKEFWSLLVWHLVHPIVTEMPVQFEVLILLPLRVEGKTSLTEVKMNAVTTVFSPAVLAPVITRFHEFSLMDKSSRILHCLIHSDSKEVQ